MLSGLKLSIEDGIFLARYTNITALTVFFLAVAKEQETNSEQQLNQ
jgi:hypothetical protein